jgi:hypothetical protein
MLSPLPLLLLLLVAPGDPARKAASPATLTLKGQVACFVCWDEEDRTKKPYGTKDDLECAALCSNRGVPASLAVTANGATELYVLEEGTFKKGKDGWLPYMAKTVEVVGTERREEKKRILRVDAMKVLGEGK